MKPYLNVLLICRCVVIKVEYIPIQKPTEFFFSFSLCDLTVCFPVTLSLEILAYSLPIYKAFTIALFKDIKAM